MRSFLASLVLVVGCAHSSPPSGRTFDATEQLRLLLAQADLDGDGRITARDERANTPLRVAVPTSSGTVTVEGAGRLAHAADLLAAEAKRGGQDAPPRHELLKPRSEVLRALVRRSWWLLTRRASSMDDLLAAMARRRAADGKVHVFFPEDDPAAGEALRAEKGRLRGVEVVVESIPRKLSRADFERLEKGAGLLYLPHPYVVPGGHFNEQYGWDSYFMAEGALADGQRELALDMLENFLYQIDHYGKIGNSNRSVHRSRTQPPFLPTFGLRVAENLPNPEARRALLERVARSAHRELEEIWHAPPRITESKLSLYHDEHDSRPPELHTLRYSDWQDTADYYSHQRAVRESGWDMTHRFGVRGHRVVPVELNALLYRYERDLAEIHRRLEGAGSGEAARLERSAAERRARMDALFWDEGRGLYFDWDPEAKKRTSYEHVASFYALWAGAASPEQARKVAANLPLFEMPGGLAVSSERSVREAGGEALQWDWPAGWAPHQVLAVEGLRRYGFSAEAERLSLAWLSMVFDVAWAHNGLIKEKYDVVQRSADVPAEYGNQGGDRGLFAGYDATCKTGPRRSDCVRLDLIAPGSHPVGFGWTNASISVLMDALSPEARARLDASAR